MKQTASGIPGAVHGGKQRIVYVVCVGRLAQEIHGTKFDGCDSGRDVSIARQNNRARVAALLVQPRHDLNSVAILQTKVNYGKGRRLLLNHPSSLCYRAGGQNMKTALLHRPFQTFEKHSVVVDYQERIVGDGERI